MDFQNQEVVRKYYEASAVFVHPTREDIWGLVINEAMAAGVPVIHFFTMGRADNIRRIAEHIF